MKDSKNLSSFLSFAFMLTVLFLWEILCFTKVIPNYLLPSPFEILNSYRFDFVEYQRAFFSTFENVLQGLALSFVLSSILALLFSWFPRIKQAVLPLCLFFQTVPLIAIAPLMVIWLGFGKPTVIASCVVVSFFPILANLMLGLSQTSKSSLELFQLYRASRQDLLFKLQIPSSLPSLFAGLEIAVGLGIVGALVGEFVAGGGLGGLIDSARTQQKIEMVFGAVLLSSFMGGVLIATLHFFRSKMVRS